MIASDESREINTICFLMCKSCYWCASYLPNNGKHILMCPLCGSNKLHCFPVSYSDGKKNSLNLWATIYIVKTTLPLGWTSHLSS